MNKNIDRKFSGVWFPRNLYLSKEFTWVEKILIVEINSLDKDGNGCFASNQYLAEFINSTAGHIANTISKLRKLEHIVDLTSDDNKRKIRLSEELRTMLGEKEINKSNNQIKEMTESQQDYQLMADEVEVSPDTDIKHQEFLIKGPKNKEAVETIFEFWNSYKGKTPWKSHEKVTYDISEAINEALKHYTISSICSAIDNYAKVLLDGKYFWTHAWSLSIFLTVKNGPAKDAPKKWYQFTTDNFVETNYLTNRLEKLDEEGEYDEELVGKLIVAYGRMINNTKFVPNQRQKHKFIEASRSMGEFFGRHKIIKDNWITHLTNCLTNTYLERGDPLYPGHFSSENTWGILMPQYLSEIGVGV